jgi:phospholipid transport system substrate-binding protein
MAETLDGRRDYFENNPDELYSLVDGVLSPHFDTRYAGRLVLGKHWKGASNEQRAEFIDAFYEFLMRSYARGVLQFDQDRIEILPARDDVDGKRAIVKTNMRFDDGTLVPVNYSMRKSSAGWRVYDVRIEGISYIQNYRNQFNAEIHALGVDAVIERLRIENAAYSHPDPAASEAAAADVQ